MGFHNPPLRWSEFERTLSGAAAATPAGAPTPPARPSAAPREPAGPVVRYAELHAHSAFSFLDGASQAEELVAEAARLRLAGLALTDHDGFYGLVRFAEAAEEHPGLATVFGAELSLELRAPHNGAPDPEGRHLLVLARGQEGYHRLAGAITDAQLAGGQKGRPRYDLDRLADRAGGHWFVLTGCRKGAVRQALAREGVDGAGRELDALIERFGTGNVAVELTHRGEALDDARNDALAELAARERVPVVATGNVHYATPHRFPLASAMAAVRARRSLDELDGWLPAAPVAHLRSGTEMAALFRRYPGAVEHTADIADDLAFRLRSLRPGLPHQEVPSGHTSMSWLRHLVWGAAQERYPGLGDGERQRIEHELAVIEQKDFPGYFLIVHDIVSEARRRGILCQGRGSAANSAVCYLLGITAVDPIFYRLPFERFLSSLRDEEPDIDVDFDAGRREEIIQYVYEKYGRKNAAQVANVISYRPRNAVRDMAKALGHSPGQQDAWSRQLERHHSHLGEIEDIPPAVIDLAGQLLRFPRHLGIHSGGMVLTQHPIGEIVPIEPARKDRRTVLQWDKDDCAWMGLVKFDLLGLGILAALQHCFDLIEEHCGEKWSLATLPREEAGVYDMLCRADSIGVFQVESRAQMGLLPRLRPRGFYDLAVEIAMIRPGPIQGGAVHPYVRRRLDPTLISYPHPKLEPVLARTLGVPVFQEQLMQMAVAVGECTPEDADLLRRAMGSKRGLERIGRLREKLYAGMAKNGLDEKTSDQIYRQIEAFADFGFAESHSLSFALLVYASTWLKLHYPAAFLAALLRAQPMGFYSPATLTADARRHGVEVRRVDLLLSGVDAELESNGAAAAPLREACLGEQPPVAPFDPAAPPDYAAHRRDGGLAVRLGLAQVKGIGTALAERLVEERTRRGPYRDLSDLVRRTGLTTAQLEALATADAFACFGLSVREALWQAGEAAQNRAEFLAGSGTTIQVPLLPLSTDFDTLLSDLRSTGISPHDHPIRHLRTMLRERGAVTVGELVTAEPGRRIQVGGVVTHRQRPSTAGGITFVNLEDETGLVNVVCSKGLWSRYRRVARQSPALIVRGMLERSEHGVINVVADRLEPLPLAVPHRSRDFQ